MSPSTETLPQYDLERGQRVEIGLSHINNANLCPPPLYLKRCPVLHSPPSYKSQDQGELEAQTDLQEPQSSRCSNMKEISRKVVAGARKVGDQTVKTTGAILRTVFSVLKQVLKSIATGIFTAGIVIIKAIWFLIKWIAIIIWCVLVGAVVAAVPLGFLGGFGYFIYWAVSYRWVWIVDATIPDQNCTWYFNGFNGPESLAYHWLWVTYKSFVIHEGWYHITLHPNGSLKQRPFRSIFTHIARLDSRD